MKALGRVVTISHSGRLIVRAAWAPELGARVVDREQRPVGTVAALLGPVHAPYIAVRPAREPGQTLLKMIGRDVYAN
ncbi:MAG: H/ACA ribonucleoprotein complex subunit GAR1 [Thermoplasmatota archaeon]